MLVLVIIFVDDILGQFALSLWCHCVVLLFKHLLSYLHQLLWRIILEIENIREAALHARIRLQHSLHFLSIARQDNNQVGIITTQIGKQCLNNTHTEISFVITLSKQIICLVNEQHASTGTVDGIHGILLRHANKLPNEFSAVCHNYMA